MRATLIALVCYLSATASWGVPQPEYKRLRVQQRPVAFDDAQQLKAKLPMLRGKVVEVRGVITGLVGEQKINALIKAGTVDLQLLAKPCPELRMSNRVRALCKVSPDESTNSLEVIALTCDYGGPLGPSSSDTASSQTAAPIRGYNLPSRSGDIVAAYQRAISYFNRRLKPAESRAIAEAVLAYSARVGLDARLIMAVIAAESSFNPGATSHAGAMGLGQLMPGTAAGLGVRDPYNVYDNLWGCVKLIRGHLDKHAGNPQQFALALASYNAGSGAVRKYGGVPPYRETRNYIWKIYGLYLSFLTPEERAAITAANNRKQP